VDKEEGEDESVGGEFGDGERSVSDSAGGHGVLVCVGFVAELFRGE
jgi:hypothetical protein